MRKIYLLERFTTVGQIERLQHIINCIRTFVIRASGHRKINSLGRFYVVHLYLPLVQIKGQQTGLKGIRGSWIFIAQFYIVRRNHELGVIVLIPYIQHVRRKVFLLRPFLNGQFIQLFS
ncbi:hypothetical protein D3C71_1824390 [compost metagenome]